MESNFYVESRGPDDLVSDWYLPEDNPAQGFVYPGPYSIGEQDKLLPLARKLIEECQKREDPTKDAFILKVSDRLYRGQKINSVQGVFYALRRVANVIPDINLLGLEPAVKQVLLHRRLSTGGLIIVSGETGQGKSTTCAASIKARMEKYGSFCLTVEDPPELPLHGVHEKGRCIQTEVEQGGFANALRTAMRSYPSVSGSMLYVGETRDSETAAEVLRIVTNGHLVLTTLHGSDIVSSIKRFIALCIGKGLSEEEVKSTLSSSLRMVLHQKLINLPPIQNRPARKKLETQFLLSASSSTVVANKIRSNHVDTIVSEIQQQRFKLDNQGLEALMEDWNTRHLD